jgi:SAM-dependent methyltransferase
MFESTALAHLYWGRLMPDIFGQWNWDDAAVNSSPVVARQESAPIYEAVAAEARRMFLQFAFPEMAPGEVLEVGCGKGQWLRLLRTHNVRAVGGDRSFPMLRRARSVADVVQFDAAGLPFADGSFENVLTVTVLQHLPEPIAAVAELARVARDRIVIFEMTWSPAPQRLTRGTSAHPESWYKAAFATHGWAVRAAHQTRRPAALLPFQHMSGGRSALLSLPRSVGLLLSTHTWIVFEPRAR